jgi:hypothetical protein
MAATRNGSTKATAVLPKISTTAINEATTPTNKRIISPVEDVVLIDGAESATIVVTNNTAATRNRTVRAEPSTARLGPVASGKPRFWEQRMWIRMSLTPSAISPDIVVRNPA